MGLPASAVRAYLEELGIPSHDVHYDLPRLRRLALDAIGAMSDEELAAAAEAPPEVVPALRGARDLNEAREIARTLFATRAPEPTDHPETLARFRELRAGAAESLDQAAAKEILRELKAVGGNLKSLRRALTGADRGPELWTVLVALPRDEALRRADAAGS